MIANYVLVKQLVGVLLLLDLFAYTPLFFTFFGRGYEPNNSWWNSTGGLLLTYVAWLVGVLAVICDFGGLLPTAVLFLIFRHYFIAGRWRSLLRGAGAPGYISHYAILFLCLFESSFIIDPSLQLAQSISLLFRVDFAFIMLCAGLYKACVGYLARNGMEYGCVNPLWGYHHTALLNVSPSHIFWHLQNIAGFGGEIVAGILLLTPGFHAYGGLLCMLAFAYVSLNIRLGRLAFLMMVLPILFFPSFDQLVGGGYGFDKMAQVAISPLPSFLLLSFHLLIGLYCFVGLPMIKVMQYMNLFFDKQFPSSLQHFLEKLASITPVIIWRVFTPDVVNFFVRISFLDKETGAERNFVHEDTIYNYRHISSPIHKHRFLQVTESITIACIFNSLKYFKSQPQIFNDKLLRYAATFPKTHSEIVRFTYISIVKIDDAFQYIPSERYEVDVENALVINTSLVDGMAASDLAANSPIRESVSYGSYVKQAM